MMARRSQWRRNMKVTACFPSQYRQPGDVAKLHPAAQTFHTGGPATVESRKATPRRPGAA
ncbi:MAG: hypothetical protein N2652_03310 [Kiritimatiellae bacterium]|nr:hypothetical protein [Kiritimatiellia bacterium]